MVFPAGYSLTKKIDTSGYIAQSYPYGQCTWFVFNRAKEFGINYDPYMGNGGNGSINQAMKPLIRHEKIQQLALHLVPLDQTQPMVTLPLWNKSNQMVLFSYQNQMPKV